MNNIVSRTIKFGIIALVALLIVGCIEEIEKTSFSYERLLVVDANISDQQKVHEVRLSYTSPVDGNLDDGSNAATGARVWVEDNQGNQVDFTENEPGHYTSTSNFAAEAGKSYALFITTSEGKDYQSAYEELVPAPEITNIYNRFTIEPGDGEATSVPGVQFFIDSDDAGQSSQFFRYEWTDTHQVIVPYPKKYEAVRDLRGNWVISEVNRDLSECYKERSFDELILATSTNTSTGELREVPIKFSAASLFDVTTMYSIEVTQRAISSEAYSYYRKIELFNESNGTLFDKQQGIIIGNIVSVDDPNENVLGYFEVSGATSKRIFMQLSDLDEPVQDYLNRPCLTNGPIMVEGMTIDQFYNATDVEEGVRGSEISRRSLYELFDVGYTGEMLFGYRLCVDCTRRGSLGKPAYWP